MNKKSFRTLSSLAIAIATVTSGAYAAELEEVIVTAQKRAESLQEVPVSLTSAISGAKIEEAGLHSFAEMSAYVPNLAITENAVKTIIQKRTMRWYRCWYANQSFEQSVIVSMLMASTTENLVKAELRFLMFNKSEVLRGPQLASYLVRIPLQVLSMLLLQLQTRMKSLLGKLSGSKESFGGTTLTEGALNRLHWRHHWPAPSV